MNKLFTIALAFLYLAISSGLILEIHYCMGKVAATQISLSHNDEDACGKCGMDTEDNHCCKDEIKLVKLQDAHKQVNFDYQLLVPVAILPETTYPLAWFTQPADHYNTYSNHSPPYIAAPSLHILHCVFRI